MTALEIMTDAWGAVYDERRPGDARPSALERLLEESDPAERREQMRDVYAFLHAQQLVHSATSTKRVENKVDTLLLSCAPMEEQKSDGRSKLTGFMLLCGGTLLGVAGTIAFQRYAADILS